MAGRFIRRINIQSGLVLCWRVALKLITKYYFCNAESNFKVKFSDALDDAFANRLLQHVNFDGAKQYKEICLFRVQ